MKAQVVPVVHTLRLWWTFFMILWWFMMVFSLWMVSQRFSLNVKRKNDHICIGVPISPTHSQESCKGFVQTWDAVKVLGQNSRNIACKVSSNWQKTNVQKWCHPYWNDSLQRFCDCFFLFEMNGWNYSWNFSESFSLNI